MLSDLFRTIGTIDNPTEVMPIVLSQRSIAILRCQLRGAGFDLNLAPEQAESLRKTQFRSLRTGRGEGFTTVMHSDNFKAIRRAELIWNRTLELANQFGGHRIISAKTKEPLEGTQNRGVIQALADIVSIAALPGEEDEFLRRLNRRLWRSLLLRCKSDDERATVNHNFADYGDPPSAKTASVPLGALRLAWLYLLAVGDATQ